MSVAVATAESDSRLIQRVAGGDRDAFTELYRRFARPVFAMAVRQLRTLRTLMRRGSA